MLITITSAKCVGINAIPTLVEISASDGIGIRLVGLADAAVKESLLRTCTALQSWGLRIPGKKIVINLTPGDLHKTGIGYDLPIALGMLAASGQIHMSGTRRYVIMGELGLDGSVRKIDGALPIVEMADKMGMDGCILPYESALEAVEYGKGKIFGVHNLGEAINIVCELEDWEDLEIDEEMIMEEDDRNNL